MIIVERKTLLNEAFIEAIKKYPECEDGLCFYIAATIDSEQITEDDIKLAKSLIDLN